MRRPFFSGNHRWLSLCRELARAAALKRCGGFFLSPIERRPATSTPRRLGIVSAIEDESNGHTDAEGDGILSR
ncbi:hypothetical protein PSP6_210147 [Paraburkholderia tropica]|nr:hypothetical protein PSP6_210147 [Paraburkholderia tropica]